MSCFVVPMTEALITTVASRVAKHIEKKSAAAESAGFTDFREKAHIPFSRKLQWLSDMLWGGSALLMLEHAWHGEFFPAGAQAMFHEMATVGVSMSLLVTCVWGAMCAAVNLKEKTYRRELAAVKVKER